MTKPLRRWTFEYDGMTVLIRATKRGGLRIKTTDPNGDAVREFRVAAEVGEVMQAAYRQIANDPDFRFVIGPMRHIDDHGATDGG